jgi:hypothetical protein
MQPLVIDDQGCIRFKGNAIVERLFREQLINLNAISGWDVPIEDKEQFWQLLGFSVSGYGDVSFVRDSTYNKADAAAAVLRKRKT